MGENDDERDALLLEIEQECLEVYRRKVDHANRSRASLHQWIAEIHSQIVALASSLGDRPPVSQVTRLYPHVPYNTKFIVMLLMFLLLGFSFQFL